MKTDIKKKLQEAEARQQELLSTQERGVKVLNDIAVQLVRNEGRIAALKELLGV